ncbi:MAG: hypothetical protein V7739_15120 [Motiliproteus sp.]
MTNPTPTPKPKLRKLLLLILSGVCAAWLVTPSIAQVSESLRQEAEQLQRESSSDNGNQVQEYRCISGFDY